LIKLPKDIINSLNKIAEYERKSRNELKKFEDWVKNNIDEGFDFDRLRAGEKYVYKPDVVNEALSDIEYGSIPDIEGIEEVLNYYINTLRC
jgi:hypothetical protein